MSLNTVYKHDEKTAVVDSENSGIAKQAMATLLAPVSFSTEKAVTQRTQAVNVLIWGGSAFLIGELIGHRRAASGGQAYIPFFRP